MAKEILLYGDITSDAAVQFIQELEASADEDIVVRINSGGGEVSYGYGMIAKYAEHAKGKKIKVDGDASSMAFFYLLYADEAKALDVTRSIMHRASYGEWLESSEYFTDGMKQDLVNTNSGFEKAFRNRANIEAFESLPFMVDNGYKTKDIFSMDGRIDVPLSAKDLKQIGLINEIINITPKKRAEIEARMVAKVPGYKMADIIIEQKINNNTMTLAELREKHPSIYAEAIQAGIAIEKDRVEGIMVFNEIDPAGVKAAIESGKQLSSKQTAEFAMKSFSMNALKGLEKDSTQVALTTDQIPVVEIDKKAAEIAAFEASLKVKQEARLNLKK